MSYYFGYGSNMSREFLEKVRGVFPSTSIIGSLKDYQLLMNLKGPNFIEPSFANISFKKGEKVEGMLHKISDTELNQIIASEGPEYRVVEVSIVTKARSVVAKTLMWPTNETEELPTSRRYLELLLKAAKKNGLSQEYIQKIQKKRTVYYPLLSECLGIYAYIWVRSRARKVAKNKNKK